MRGFHRQGNVFLLLRRDSKKRWSIFHLGMLSCLQVVVGELVQRQGEIESCRVERQNLVLDNIIELVVFLLCGKITLLLMSFCVGVLLLKSESTLPDTLKEHNRKIVAKKKKRHWGYWLNSA